MFGLRAHCFFLEHFGSGLVLGLVVDIVVVIIVELVLLILLLLLKFVVELCILNKLVFIVFE